MAVRDFDSVYADYSRMVYWTAYGVMKSDADAADISQTVFLRVLSHMGTVSPMGDAQIKSWLYRVTVNACMDLKRKHKRELLSDELPEPAVTDVSSLPEASALSKEQKMLLRSAVDALPEIYRLTVMLHYFSGLGYEEIAKMTSTTVGTVKSRMSRAKAKLFEALKGGGLA